MNERTGKHLQKQIRAIVILLVISTSVYSAPDQSGADSNLDPDKLSASFRQAAERVRTGIVTIRTMSGPRTTAEWSRRNHDSTRPSEIVEAEGADPLHDAYGSGIIFDERGYVLTCNHVIADAENVFVYLDDGRRFESARILADPVTDIAVIQLAVTSALPTVQLGDSERLQVGDWVMSIGNPYGLGVSSSAGIISATRRYLPWAPRTPLIQTDAATNPGNSGGALINLHGDVVGISEGGFGVDEGFQGIGFAIPIFEAKRIAMQLIDRGDIPRAYLGCLTQTLSPAVGEHLSVEEGRGLLVTDVASESPADRAGIQVGDVITKLGDTAIRNHNQLSEVMDQLSPGQTSIVSVVRGGRGLSISVRLDSLPAFTDGKKRISNELELPSDGYHYEPFGLVVNEMQADIAKQLGYDQPRGVLVTHVSTQSIASREGICAGMAILRIGNQSISTVAEFKQTVVSTTPDAGLLVLMATPHRKHFVLLRK